MSVGAWVRTEDNTYGHRKYPFGQCSEGGCEAAACHRIYTEANADGFRLVCREHVPSRYVFVPFLGQQEKLFEATERWVLGGGGAGPGKTYAGARLWLKQFHGEHARYLKARKEGKHFQSKGWALFCRRTMPELLQVINDFKKYYKRIDPKAKWNQNEKTCSFACGYIVQFAGMEDEDDYLKYYGGEYTLIVLDEAVQFTKKQILEIDSRLRCSDPVLSAQLQLYLLTNPVGPTANAAATKAWLKKRFVRRADPEQAVKLKVKLADGREIIEWQVYIPCNIYDNPALLEDGKYEANLMLKGVHMRRALLLNDWDVDQGAWVGDDWDPTVHIRDPFKIPGTWPKYKQGDYGMRSLSSVQWVAVTPDGAHIVYRAWNCRGLTAKEMIPRLKRIEQQPLKWHNPRTGKTITVVEPEWNEASDCSTIFGPLDASCWSKQGESENGESRGEQFETGGVGFYPSAKGAKLRHDAADHIRYRLRTPVPDLNGSLETNWRLLMFFRDTTDTRMTDEDGQEEVVGPTRSIPVLPFDEKDPDVWDTKANDHDMDALAYGQLSRPPGGEHDEMAEVIQFMDARVRAPANPERISW